MIRKTIFSLFLMAAALAGRAQDEHFGAVIDDKDAITLSELWNRLENKESLETKVEAKVLECCQAKGCWMEVDAGNGETMRVRFKDYGFFVPKNSAGKTAVMRGVASVETISVAELKHYAEDAGQSKEEIDRITEPRKQLVFLADGVILKD